MLSTSYRKCGGRDRLMNSTGIKDGDPLCFPWNAGKPSRHNNRAILVILSETCPISSFHHAQSYTSLIMSGSPCGRLHSCFTSVQYCSHFKSCSNRCARGNQTTNSRGFPPPLKRCVPHFGQTSPISVDRQTWSQP